MLALLLRRLLQYEHYFYDSFLTPAWRIDFLAPPSHGLAKRKKKGFGPSHQDFDAPLADPWDRIVHTLAFVLIKLLTCDAFSAASLGFFRQPESHYRWTYILSTTL